MHYNNFFNSFIKRSFNMTWVCFCLIFRLSSERPYDAKKSCWVPCPKDGFAQGDIRGVKGDQITVFASNKVCKKYTGT